MDAIVKNDIHKMMNCVIRNMCKARKTLLADDLADTMCILNWEVDVRRIKERVEKEIFIAKDKIGFRELSPTEIQSLQDFNDQLWEFEKQIKKEAEAIEKSYIDHVAPLDCFHIDIRFEYFIGKNDTAYSDDRDNMITRSTHTQPGEMDDGENYNAMKGTHSPNANHHHCWSFKDLYEHATPPITLRDILRISRVTAVIKVHYDVNLDIKYRHDFTRRPSNRLLARK